MMLIPAHREVMNLVYYQAKSIEEVTKLVAARRPNRSVQANLAGAASADRAVLARTRASLGPSGSSPTNERSL